LFSACRRNINSRGIRELRKLPWQREGVKGRQRKRSKGKKEGKKNRLGERKDND
jgi:hypothetical protein